VYVHFNEIGPYGSYVKLHLLLALALRFRLGVTGFGGVEIRRFRIASNWVF
jgi:hypothetical protein